MKKNTKNQILDTISDLCSNFLYYDRNGDEDLSMEQLNNAVADGEITIDEMVCEFRKHLENNFKGQNESGIPTEESILEETENSVLEEQENESDENTVPCKWAKIVEIETWIGGEPYENKGGRARLIVTHYCGDSKKDLIDQLETLIHGLKNEFDSFGC